MGYLEDFRERLDSDDYPGFLHLWEEYCEIDEVDGSELEAILSAVRDSRLAQRFGSYIGTSIQLWQKIADKEKAFDVLRLIIDLETTNSPDLAEVIFNELSTRYGDDRYFHEKLRLIGLRSRDSFQGAIRNYELLSHLEKGAFVYHTGGWGTGEVMELSLTREDLVLEFEGVPGKRSVSFENAFRQLVPLAKDHFLARRFGNPDSLEEEARRDPVGVIRLLLRDLGPKSAAEIKEELCEYVIPADDWTKWWQATRSRIKKDTMIETPATVRLPFRLRLEEVTHSKRLQQALSKELSTGDLLMTIYNFVRDFPEVLKDSESIKLLRDRLSVLREHADLDRARKLELLVLTQEFFPSEADNQLAEAVAQSSQLIEAIDEMAIPAFKKRVLISIREVRKDWIELFLKALFLLPQGVLRDYLLKELDTAEARPALIERIVELVEHPDRYPLVFVWYFQKVMAGEELPYGTDKEAQCACFEAFLILLHLLERVEEQRDTVKKIYGMLCGDRYKIIRDVLDGSSLAFAQEFLLLVTKCRTFSDHDLKIMDSLARVAHPSLDGGRKPGGEEEERVIWTTEEGYHKVQERIRELSTVEAVKNAREVEEARSHGDLRENADYKGALERRQRIQAELRALSEQTRRARILTKSDVSDEEVGIGTVVTVVDTDGSSSRFTLLGPWDADSDRGILSIQSRFAQELKGRHVGDRFSFQGKEYQVESFQSIFE
jgi:transcription elongation factor GreA-like protein/transcription elongation GreA/GreB family factor